MATEMPIEQDYGRNIDGVQATDEDMIVDVPDMGDSDIEETPDGGAIVTMPDDFKGPSDDTDFYENLAETVNLIDLSKLTTRYIDMLDKDKQARKKRDKQYEDGIKRTGLGDEAPGGANFMGASRVVHPVMAEVCVDFAASAIKELFPPDGPVRTNILGEVTDEKTEVAERKRDYMNWQLTEQIPEFRDETEQLLTQLPLGGSQYMKLWFDEKLRRPCAEFIPIDNILLPFAAANFYSAQRVSEIQDISEWEFDNRIKAGLYRDISYIRASAEPEESGPQKATNEIEGRESDENDDGLRRVFHIYTWLELEDDGFSEGEMAPYILMIDETDNKVLGLYRNWEMGDKTMDKLDWIVEFKFIPWRGAYAIGLPHLIGGLSAALTGALRALLDTAHVNNSLTMLKLKGGRNSGQTQQPEMTQVTEIEAAPGIDDIRKIAMPMPFNPPSPVLFELLGWLDNAAKGVVSTAEEKIADMNANMPVGTTQALIEQGAKVFSSIHARLHDSQRRVLGVLGRINRWYLDDQKKGDMVADLAVTKADFERNTDVVPVSDPHIFSETQRMAQSQAVLALMEKYPQEFNSKAVLGRILKQMKVPNISELMPAAAKPEELDAANENAAMALGKPAFAYPRQDQLAHIQTHLNFAVDPIMGSNPMIAQVYIPQALEHIKQHMMLWYTNQMTTYVTGGTDITLQKYEKNKLASTVDKAVALASDHVKIDTAKTFEKVVPILQQLGEMMAQFAPKPPVDPESQAVLQASMAETQRRAARDGVEMELKKKDQEIDVAMNVEKLLTQERMKTADLSVEEAKLKREQERTVLDLNQATQRNLGE
jgi:hypothetical protein